MRVYLKLLGFLSQQFPEYAPRTGLIVDLPGGSTVKDLLKHLNIDTSDDNVVISYGRVLQAQDRLSEGSCISIFPIVHGG
jgi:sulfur carrier protein ThiS